MVFLESSIIFFSENRSEQLFFSEKPTPSDDQVVTALEKDNHVVDSMAITVVGLCYDGLSL